MVAEIDGQPNQFVRVGNPFDPFDRANADVDLVEIGHRDLWLDRSRDKPRSSALPQRGDRDRLNFDQVFGSG